MGVLDQRNRVQLQPSMNAESHDVLEKQSNRIGSTPVKILGPLIDHIIKDHPALLDKLVAEEERRQRECQASKK